MKLYTAGHDAPAGYSPSIHLEGPEHEHSEELTSFLDRISCWGGNTSNSPSEYSRWEIPKKHIIFADLACKESGYFKVKWFQRREGVVHYCRLDGVQLFWNLPTSSTT